MIADHLWIQTTDRLPTAETPVLIVCNGVVHIGELRWEHPSFEDTFKSYRYWDDPNCDGQDWQWDDITAWQPIPVLPVVALPRSGDVVFGGVRDREARLKAVTGVTGDFVNPFNKD